MSSSEYNQLLKFLYFEGYADSYEEAEYILEEMSDEEFEELIEAKDIPQEVALKLAGMLRNAPPLSRRGGMARGLRQFAIDRNKKRLAKLQQNEEIEELDERKLAHSFPLKPSERRTVETIRARLDGEKQQRPTRSARRVEQPATQEQPRKKRKLEFEVKEDFEAIVEFLFVEGYADTIERAELMAECISEEWVNEILEKFNPSDYKEYDQKNHRDERNPSAEWDAQEKDYQDSRGDIRDKHNQARGVKIKKGKK